MKTKRAYAKQRGTAEPGQQVTVAQPVLTDLVERVAHDSGVANPTYRQAVDYAAKRYLAMKRTRGMA